MPRHDIVYNVDHTELKRKTYIKTLISYLAVVAMVIYVNYVFGAFSVFVTAVVISIWAISIYMYFKTPFIRLEVLKNCKRYSGGYLLALILIQIALQYFGNLSPDALYVTSNRYSAPETVSNSAVSALRTMFFLLSITVPASFAWMMYQKRNHYVVPHEDKILRRYRKLK